MGTINIWWSSLGCAMPWQSFNILLMTIFRDGIFGWYFGVLFWSFVSSLSCPCCFSVLLWPKTLHKSFTYKCHFWNASSQNLQTANYKKYLQYWSGPYPPVSRPPKDSWDSPNIIKVYLQPIFLFWFWNEWGRIKNPRRFTAIWLPHSISFSVLVTRFYQTGINGNSPTETQKEVKIYVKMFKSYILFHIVFKIISSLNVIKWNHMLRP